MEFIQDYLPQIAYLYNTYYRPYSPYLNTIYRYTLLAQSYFYRNIFPILYPLYTLVNNAIQSISSDAPDLSTLFVLAIALLLSLRILDYMRRTIVYWISLAVRMAMWVMVAAVGFYVWQRGAEQSVEDFGWLWGLLAGLGDEGEKIGGRKAVRREREARRMSGMGKRRMRGEW